MATASGPHPTAGAEMEGGSRLRNEAAYAAPGQLGPLDAAALALLENLETEPWGDVEIAARASVRFGSGQPMLRGARP